MGPALVIASAWELSVPFSAQCYRLQALHVCAKVTDCLKQPSHRPAFYPYKKGEPVHREETSDLCLPAKVLTGVQSEAVEA